MKTTIRLAERIIKLNEKKLKDLVKTYEGYQFKFFIAYTNRLLSSKNAAPLTPQELLDSDDNFDIVDHDVIKELNLVQVDLHLFPKRKEKTK